jgi:hypothetical protein
MATHFVRWPLICQVGTKMLEIDYSAIRFHVYSNLHPNVYENMQGGIRVSTHQAGSGIVHPRLLERHAALRP